MNPMSNREKAKLGVMSRILTLSRTCAHAKSGETRDLRFLKAVKAKSYEVPLDVKRQLSARLTPKLGAGDIHKLGEEHTVSIRPGITKAMGQIPLAYEYGLRRRDKQLTENTVLDANTCNRCQFCVENLLMTDRGLFRLNMLCYSMGFLCAPNTVCRQWHEGQGRTIVLSDIRSDEAIAKKSVEEVLMEYVDECVRAGKSDDEYYEDCVSRMKAVKEKEVSE